LSRLEATIDALRRFWAGESVTSPELGLRDARVAPPPMQHSGPPVWVAAMGPRAIALAARCADGWEASFLAPAAFADAVAHVDAACRAAGRARGLGRSVELDVALADTQAATAAAIDAFAQRRGLARDHPLLDAALIGDAEAVIAQALAYGAAGATDLMLGFADFPDTTMLERFARRVLPALTTPTRHP
jgi:alkanesulfonate monooxygenase SsuD/methylene tetrahydromethanopterin reductase-like flavin-dependent oxidoreductase (luciferase family)